MRLIEFSLSRRVTIAMAAVALVLFGLVAFQRLSINLLPDLSYPSLTVETRYSGAAPGEVESLVTRPIEEVVGVVSGVQRLTSVSRPGVSQVTLEFAWDRDMDFAALDVREKLDVIRLPEQAQKPIVLRFDPADDPILRCQQVVLTPHSADGTPEGIDLLNRGAVDNAIAFFEGKPRNVVTG
jgi:HAE1 family hydrophobic/amphiphilic exporter-1